MTPRGPGVGSLPAVNWSMAVIDFELAGAHAGRAGTALFLGRMVPDLQNHRR